MTLSYQWKRGGVAIPGATDQTYTPTAVDTAKSLTVTVTGSKEEYTTAARTSLAKTVQGVLTATPTPSISGTTTVGYRLYAAPGAWAPAPVALYYQWMRNGSPISGATGSSYVTTKYDYSHEVSVRVTGTKASYLAVARTSDPVWISAPAMPADKDCKDFSSHAAAVAFFLFWYPYYGDFARLDGDNDMNPCESLR